MKNNPPSADDDTPKQKHSDVPGPAVIIPEGIYKIYTHLNNTSVVDMRLVGTPKPAQIFHDNNEPESRWRIKYDDRFDAHTLTNQYPGARYLYVVNYSEVYAEQTLNIVKPQYHWTFKNVGSDTNLFYIENVYTLHVLDVEGSGTADRTKINALPYKGSANQKFKLVKLSDF